ncbi:PaaI family thioesterase [Afifella sp. IM 167]|uniref:PaaI family thioesterase n=1 Tax=Afifella sp. IM 167 TaxID=2033586 RepID=UPI001CCE28D3|nr:PaaI family thioesterase [Afifella sp. IM 167]MBZ8132936.1 aromatic compound degradation protein PaaI [Afifella sp. IM 167]
MVENSTRHVGPEEALAELKTLGGLKFLKAIQEGRLPQPPIADLMGFRLAEVEEGRAVFTGTPDERVYNPIGSVHGGYAATLLDSCMSCAVHSQLLPGFGYTTLEFKVNLLRRISAQTGPVRAEGKVVHLGRQIACSDGQIIDGEGRVLAHGTATCLVFAFDRGPSRAGA